ncbi:MAG: hypothetical protein IPM34_03520 [Saprospiraceae bacterium]|nr:hypothetical protein [Saprospiraceae bacterium]
MTSREDLQHEIYLYYLQHTDSEVEILDKYGRIITGYVSGIYTKLSENEQTNILKWHLVSAEDRLNLGLYPLGFLRGELVRQEDIISFTFRDQNIVFNF